VLDLQAPDVAEAVAIGALVADGTRASILRMLRELAPALEGLVDRELHC
jgi:hypothetical protein